MGVSVLCLFLTTLFATLLLLFFRPRKRLTHKRPKLPPGSLGWPYVGETLTFFSQDPNLFFSIREKRYGDVFKTRVLGCPCVVLATPEAAKFVLATKAHLFKPTYPRSKERLIGPWALFFHQSTYHAHVRKLVQSSLSLDAVRNLVPDIEAAAVATLDSLCSRHSVENTFHQLKKFTFEVAVLSIFGHLDNYQKERLKSNYYSLDKGYNSLPINLPRFSYRRSLLARRMLNEILKEMIWERREKRLVQNDMLNNLLISKDKEGNTLTDDQIADNIIGVLFAAQDTTASVLTWILKYIYDDHEVLDAIKFEQKKVYESNENGSLPLTWSQTRSMPITSKAISESLRLASIISYTYREAVEDVEYKGYLIPKGWKVLPSFRSVHHNPDFFDGPLRFDPSRFEARSVKPNTFTPFGNGIHACPGNEVAKLEILIFIHHLVNNYRWEVMECKGKIEYDPFPIPWRGLPTKFWKSHHHFGDKCPI